MSMERPKPNPISNKQEEYQEPTMEQIKEMIKEGLEDIKQGRVIEITSAKELLKEE